MAVARRKVRLVSGADVVEVGWVADMTVARRTALVVLFEGNLVALEVDACHPEVMGCAAAAPAITCVASVS